MQARPAIAYRDSDAARLPIPLRKRPQPVDADNNIRLNAPCDSRLAAVQPAPDVINLGLRKPLVGRIGLYVAIHSGKVLPNRHIVDLLRGVADCRAGAVDCG